jgi:hypothetical protein
VDPQAAHDGGLETQPKQVQVSEQPGGLAFSTATHGQGRVDEMPLGVAGQGGFGPSMWCPSAWQGWWRQRAAIELAASKR